MEFELFSGLYKAALESTDKEMFIAELGWQDWMNQYNAHEIGILLSENCHARQPGIHPEAFTFCCSFSR